jgi:hypothetical protein
MSSQEPAGFGESLPEELSPESASRLAERRQARGRQFLRGPVPMAWLESAARLPGKALAVAVLIRFRDGFAPGQPVRLSRLLLERFAINRKAVYRALGGLESLGLIRLTRDRGKSPLIEVVHGPGEVR